MRKWRASAAYRIAFINFAIYAAGLALLAAIVFIIMSVTFARQLDAMVANEAQSLQHEFAQGGERQLAEDIAARETSTSANRMLYAVFAPDGRRILGTLDIQRPRAGLRPIMFHDPKEGPDVARAITVDLSSRQRLVVAVDSDWLEGIERIVVVIFGLAFLGSLIVAFAGAVLLGSYLQRRLNSISSSAEAIIGGDIRRRMPIGPRSDEFDQLAATLNRMLDRIEGLLDNLRQVSTDIAHDLRTPLARLRNHLEHGATELGSEKLLTGAVRQVDEVLSLFAAILRVAEVESGETRRYFTAVDATSLLTELAESYAAAFEDAGGALSWKIDADLWVNGDHDLLAQAVVNLVENAQRHTPAGTEVRMTGSTRGGVVRIEVADNGPGVPNAELSNVTKRFARLETSRNTTGHGLGLSLVSAVAALHGGRLTLSPAAPGLCARIEIPRGIEGRKPVPEAKSARRPGQSPGACYNRAEQ